MRRAKASSAICIAILAAALSSLAAPAGAENVHVLSQTISNTGLVGLNNPRGIAIDNSSGPSAGSIYVSDTSNHRIVKFNPAGSFVRIWGREVNEGTGPSDVCTNAGGPTDVCKAGGNGNGPGWVSQPVGIAVDSSSGPSAGSVYVAPDPGNAQYVVKFDSAGNRVMGWGGTPFPGAINGAGAPAGPFNSFNLGRMTVDQLGNFSVFSSGTVYRFAQDGSSPTSFLPGQSASGQGLVSDGAGNYFQINGNGTSIQKIGPTGTKLARVNTGTTQIVALAFDAVHGDLFALGNSFSPGPSVRLYHFNGSEEIVQSDSSTCVPTTSTGCGATETFGLEDLFPEGGGPEGIAVNNSTRKVYVVNRGQNNLKVFSLINVPKVTTGSTSNLTRTSVKFSGNVDPDGGGEVTTCKIEYGTTKAYGLSAPCTPGTTTTPVAISSELPADTLKAETEYHYRLLAGNSNGNRGGLDLTFTTPPAVGGVTTSAPTDLDRITTTLNGSFSGDGVDTSYYFEYGPTTSYGLTTPDVDHGTASGTQNISTELTNLVAYSTYHYRFVAHNKYGKTVGGDQEFLTLAPDPPLVENTYATDVAQDAATLNADIGLGLGLTVYRFEYGIGTSYGAKTLVGGPLDPVTADRTASTRLGELAPGTTYHFRVLATNFAGTIAGPDQTFTTPSAPAILSVSASAVTRSSASLSALISPGLRSTSYHFDYGATAAYGSSTPESGSIGADDLPHSADGTLSGLAAGTEYHYRVVATNAIGTTAGPDGTFTTSAQPPVVGGGESKKCKKGFVKKHGKCVRKKPKKQKHRRQGRSDA